MLALDNLQLTTLNHIKTKKKKKKNQRILWHGLKVYSLETTKKLVPTTNHIPATVMSLQWNGFVVVEAIISELIISYYSNQV